MSTTYTEPLARINGALDDLAAIAPEFRTVAEKQDLLVGLARVIARARGRAATRPGHRRRHRRGHRRPHHRPWLATATRDAHGRVRADATLAAALDQRWTQTAAAFAAGPLNLAQTRVIADALAALPKDLGEDLLAKAETLMLTEANHLGPRELQHLRGPPPGVPGPRRRRGGRLPAAPGPRNAVPPPPPGRPSGAAATGPPTCTPASPTSPPAATHLPERLHRPPPPSPDANRRRCVTSPR